MNHDMAVEQRWGVARAYCTCGWTTTAPTFAAVRREAREHQDAHA